MGAYAGDFRHARPYVCTGLLMTQTGRVGVQTWMWHVDGKKSEGPVLAGSRPKATGLHGGTTTT